MNTVYLVFDSDESVLPLAVFATAELAEDYINASEDMFFLPFAVHSSPIPKCPESTERGWKEEVEDKTTLLARAEGFIKFATPDETEAE